MRYTPELLAPAGDLLKLKIAILYGANAVFIGGKQFSLRAKASNFDLDAIKEGVEFAHARGAKVYVTVNIYPHNEDMTGLDDYLLALDAIHVDAIIVSSPYIVKQAQRLGCHFERHISTQQSVANEGSIAFFQSLSANRIVLARELSILEIQQLKQKCDLPLEVFIHGGMCSSFSGRCTLSNNMTNRDANRGGCAHSCRWSYRLYHQGQEISPHEFRMGSKDLMSFAALPALLDARVDSFKIEGRMKSLHYIAMVVRAYRQFIDAYLLGKPMDQAFVLASEQLAKRAENRDTSTGFLLGEVTNEGTLYGTTNEAPNQDFIGLAMEHENEQKQLKIQQRNYFESDDELEVMEPSGEIYSLRILGLYDEMKNPIQVARHAMQTLYLDTPRIPTPYSIIRKKQGS